ncbi:hypothetical protein T439DRAFT_346764 [Meredithblackwellia eburnea MCA 4105]
MSEPARKKAKNFVVLIPPRPAWIPHCDELTENDKFFHPPNNDSTSRPLVTKNHNAQQRLKTRSNVKDHTQSRAKAPDRDPDVDSDLDGDEAGRESSATRRKMKGKSKARDSNESSQDTEEESGKKKKEKRRRSRSSEESSKRKRKGKSKAKRRRSEEPNSEDEDDLTLSDKETVIEARLRPPKEDDRMAKYRAMQEKKKRMEKKRVIKDSEDEAEAGPSRDKDIHSGRAREKKRRERMNRPSFAGDRSSGSESGSEHSDKASNESSTDLDSNISEVDDDDEDEALMELRRDFQDRKQDSEVFVKTYVTWLIYVGCSPGIDWLNEKQADPRHVSYKEAKEYVDKRIEQFLVPLASTVWKRKFIDELKTFSMMTIDTPENENPVFLCEACGKTHKNQSTHLATFNKHSAYNRENFHHVPFAKLPVKSYHGLTDESDSEDSEGLSAEEQKKRRMKIQGAVDFQWHMGEHCKRRAELYYALCHWGLRTAKALKEEYDGKEDVDMAKAKAKRENRAYVPKKAIRTKFPPWEAPTGVSDKEKKRLRREDFLKRERETVRVGKEMDKRGFVLLYARRFQKLLDKVREFESID